MRRQKAQIIVLKLYVVSGILTISLLKEVECMHPFQLMCPALVVVRMAVVPVITLFFDATQIQPDRTEAEIPTTTLVD
jgi:hypothetical protein